MLQSFPQSRKGGLVPVDNSGAYGQWQTPFSPAADLSRKCDQLCNFILVLSPQAHGEFLHHPTGLYIGLYNQKQPIVCEYISLWCPLPHGIAFEPI